MKIVAVFAIATLLSSLSSARNVYGYILGLGTNRYAVTQIRIQSGTTTWYADGWGIHFFNLGAIRWYKNGLPTNRSYVVTVFTNGYGTRQIAFYLQSGYGDYRAPDVRF